MMTKIKRLDRSAAQDNIVILCLCLMFIMQMVIYSSVTWDGWHDKICMIGMVAEGVIIFVALFGKKVDGAEIKLLIFYVFWLFLTRFMNRDTTLAKSADHLRVVILSVSVLCCGMALDSYKRRRALNIVSILVCAFFSLLSLAAIYSAIMRTPIDLPFGISFGFAHESETHIYQTMASRNRNLSSIWFGMSLCLALYQILSCKKKIYILPLTLAAVLLYTVVGLSMSRGTMIAVCVALALFFMLIADKKLMDAKIGKRVAILALVAVVSLPVFYKGYSVFAGAIDLTRSILNISQDNTVSEKVYLNEADTEMTEESKGEQNLSESSISDPRGKESILMLGGRTYNWKSAIAAIRIEPSRLFKGGIINEYMLLPDLLNEQESRSEHFINMHNYLVDSLMLSGILGLVSMLAFTVLAVIRMIRVFFASNIDIAIKALTIPLAASFVKNMMETLIFNADDISNTLFCLVMGVFLAYSYELLPSKKAENETPLPSEN